MNATDSHRQTDGWTDTLIRVGLGNLNWFLQVNYQLVDGAVLINHSVIWTNWLASLHILKMAGRSFGRKKYYGLTVTVSSEE
jgi:hypothetical protein